MKNIKQFESFSREKEIHDICEKYKIKDYTINGDLSIDVNNSIYLSNKGLTELPLIFNIVEGSFRCDGNSLTSLKGSPRKCGDFYCNNNELTSLEGAPDECVLLECFNNNLINLKGAPSECHEFQCYNNTELRSLEYISSIEYVNINNTAISSFEHSPNSFRVSSNDKLKHICELIYKEISYDGKYTLDNMDLFNGYHIIDDRDYVNNKADKATLSMFKLKDFLEELKVDKKVDVEKLERHFYIK